jgi:hypothetical protein
MKDVSLFRLYLLRAMYLLIAVGLGSMIWPLIINHVKPWGHMQGVAICLFGALSLLSVLGLRYPLQMLPLLLFELAWKSIWLIVVAWPLWSSGTIDPANLQTMYECLLGLVLLFIIPWRYVFANYVQRPGDRWFDFSRKAPTPS